MFTMLSPCVPANSYPSAQLCDAGCIPVGAGGPASPAGRGCGLFLLEIWSMSPSYEYIQDFRDYQGVTCRGDLKPGFGNSWGWPLGCLTLLERSWACLRLALAVHLGMSGSRLKLYKVLGIICENVHVGRALSTDSLHVLQHMQQVTGHGTTAGAAGLCLGLQKSGHIPSN